MKQWLCVLGFIFFCQGKCAWAWNATGHQLIAQIAYNHLNSHTRKILNQYNHALDKVYQPQSFVRASVWLDQLKFQEFNWFNQYHFVKGYFSDDKTPLPPEPTHNAVYAIKSAVRALKNPKTSLFHKGIALRILLHVVGDVHQPLHAATHVSARFPAGDLGGNLRPLGDNAVAPNLHAYWDKGAGFLTHYRQKMAKKAEMIEKHWPCHLKKMDLNPDHWVQESHAIAVHFAYQIKQHETPSALYQQKAASITEKRIALAGCRLAALLNQIGQPARHPKKKLKRR